MTSARFQSRAFEFIITLDFDLKAEKQNLMLAQTLAAMSFCSAGGEHENQEKQSWLWMAKMVDNNKKKLEAKKNISIEIVIVQNAISDQLIAVRQESEKK